MSKELEQKIEQLELDNRKMRDALVYISHTMDGKQAMRLMAYKGLGQKYPLDGEERGDS